MIWATAPDRPWAWNDGDFQGACIILFCFMANETTSMVLRTTDIQVDEATRGGQCSARTPCNILALALGKRLHRKGTNAEGDIVLDPFMGSGTTSGRPRI